jgi:hypothetical protein
VNEEQLAAWRQVVKKAQTDADYCRQQIKLLRAKAANGGIMLKHLREFQERLARYEAILAVDDIVQRLRQLEEEPLPE